MSNGLGCIDRNSRYTIISVLFFCYFDIVRLNKKPAIAEGPSDDLCNYQFGFRRNYSTVLALIDVTKNIQYRDIAICKNNEYVLGIYLNLF